MTPDIEGGIGAQGLLRERLELALSSVDPRVTRLAASGTSITFVVRDAAGETVTVLLDRDPPAVARGEEPAEVAIELTLDQATRFARGQVSLPATLMAGRTRYRGPVRKYLAVDPVLRSLLASLDADLLSGDQ